jgi:hypothetical protein
MPAMCVLIRNAALSKSALETRWPFPVISLAQCCLCRYDPEHRAHDVDDRGAGAQRLARRSGHEGKSGLELHNLIERRTMLVRAGEIAFKRQVDEARVERAQLVITAPEPLHCAGAKIFENQVGGRDQPVNYRLAFLALQIHRQAALITVEGCEKPCAKATETAGMVAPRRRLDLDDVSAELGKDQASGRPHHCVAELQDLHASEWCRQRSLGHQAAACRRNASRLPAWINSPGNW